jgi:hypothetical protein
MACLTAAKTVTVETAQDARIQSGAKVQANRYLRQCMVECRELSIPGVGEVSGCEVRFWDSIRAGSIGNKANTPNSFILLEDDREKLMKQARVLNDVIQKIRQAIEQLGQQIFMFKGALTPERQNQKNLLESNRQSFLERLATATERRKRTLRLLEIMPDRDSLIICGTFYPPLKVSIYGKETVFRDNTSKWRLGWKNGGMRKESL